MLRFNCRCGEALEMPNEEAGGLTQCPNCKRLLDVPTEQDLAEMDLDGSVRVGSEEAHGPAGGVERLILGFSQSDDPDKDMREDLAELMIGPVPGEPRPLHLGKTQLNPYDPATGELINEYELLDDVQKKPKPRPDPAAESLRPGDATVLNYRQLQRDQHRAQVTMLRVPWALLYGANLVVVLAVTLIFAISWLIASVPVAGLLFVLTFFIPLQFALLGHYAKVIEHNGPDGMDDVPALFGAMSFYDDIFAPGVKMLFALSPVLLPMIIVGAADWRLGLAIGGCGLALTPLLLLTLCTSGQIVDLNPLVLAKVLTRISPSYAMAVVLTALAIAGHVIGLVAIGAACINTMGAGLPGQAAPKLNLPLPAWVYFAGGPIALLLGVYFGHWAAWHIACIWRLHHEQFPWIANRQLSRRKDALAQLEALNRAGRGPLHPTQAPPSRSPDAMKT